MTFRVVHKPSGNHVRCPYRIVEQATGREIDWINRYLDYEMLRRLADTTLRTYAHELLHFLRWWEGVHHTDAVAKNALTETTLLDYVRFQSGQERELTGATINQRVAIVDRAFMFKHKQSALEWQNNPKPPIPVDVNIIDTFAVDVRTPWKTFPFAIRFHH